MGRPQPPVPSYDDPVVDVDSPEEPRWLDEEELQAWRPFAPLMLLLPLELDRQLQRDSDLSLLEYYVMAGLSAAPERTMRMSTLAAWSGSQLPRLSQVVSRMEGRDLITRRPDPTDGRYTLATLTDHGFEVLEEAAPGHVGNVRRLVIDPLTHGQVKQLGSISTRILGVIRPGEEFPPEDAR